MKKLSYKIIAFVMVIAVVLGSVTAYGWEYRYEGSNPIEEVSVSFDGRLLEFTKTPEIINDRTLADAVEFLEQTGISSEWAEESGLLITNDYSEILVPVRTLCETLGHRVVWEHDIKRVHISTLHKDNCVVERAKDLQNSKVSFSCEAICDNRAGD